MANDAPEYIGSPKNKLYYHLTIITLSARLLGLNNNPKKILDWFIVPLVAITYCGGCIVTIIHLNLIFSVHVSTLLRIVESIQLIIGFFLVLISTFNSYNVHGAVTSIFENLNQMDLELASLHCQGQNLKHRLVTVLLQFLGYYLLVLALLLGHVFVEHEVVQYHGLYYSIRFLPLFGIGSMVLLFSNIAIEIRFRLQLINDTIERHAKSGKAIPDRQFQLFRIVYGLAFEVCKNLNGTLAICNLFQIGFCFISVTAKVFFVFITLNNLVDASIQDMSESFRGGGSQ